MSEDKSDKINENENEPRSRARTPLGDVTNQVIRKRSFSSLSSSSLSTSPSKLVTSKKQCSELGLADDTQFCNKAAVVVEQLENKKVNAGQYSRVSDDTTGLSPLKGGKIYRLHSPLASKNTGVVSGSRIGTDTDPSGSALDRIDLGGSECEGVNLPNEVMADEGEKNSLEQEVVGAKIGGSKLVDSGSFSLKRCSGLNEGGCSNLSGDLDSLKSCSCTFCTKVAYIWSDLHYKDVKERASVSMKSQKEASDLAQRYILETEMSRLSQGISGNVGNTEPDLTNQWKSLFLHMENVFGSETSLLQADLQALRGIRDDYKTNLEMINSLPVDVHPCSSDSSDHGMV